MADPEPRHSVAEEAAPDPRELGERCQSCGRRYEVIWAADDAMWNEVVGGPNGLRCPECFDREARAAGFCPYWFADDRHFPSPERAREARSEATTLRSQLEAAEAEVARLTRIVEAEQGAVELLQRQKDALEATTGAKARLDGSVEPPPPTQGDV